MNHRLHYNTHTHTCMHTHVCIRTNGTGGVGLDSTVKCLCHHIHTCACKHLLEEEIQIAVGSVSL